MSNEIMIMSFLSRERHNSRVQTLLPALCQHSERMGTMKLPSLSLPPMGESSWMSMPILFWLAWNSPAHAHTHKQWFVLSLCIRRRWRGLILHSRVDRSLVYFIHFTWRDACLSWLAASLRFTQHCTRQTMRQFCSRPASSGEAALDGCYCIHFELKYH